MILQSQSIRETFQLFHETHLKLALDFPVQFSVLTRHWYTRPSTTQKSFETMLWNNIWFFILDCIELTSFPHSAIFFMLTGIIWKVILSQIHTILSWSSQAFKFFSLRNCLIWLYLHLAIWLPSHIQPSKVFIQNIQWS